jgi:hypothetical protein
MSCAANSIASYEILQSMRFFNPLPVETQDLPLKSGRERGRQAKDGCRQKAITGTRIAA